MAIFRSKYAHADIEDVSELICDTDSKQILLKIMKLPAKYKIVMDLFYIEGYRVREISKMISVLETAVRKRLQNGRQMLKSIFCEGGEENERRQLC